jgi:hypothetical protein
MRKLVLVSVMTSLLVVGGILSIIVAVGYYYSPPTPAWFTGSTEDKVGKLGLIQPSYADLMLWTGIRLNELFVAGTTGKWAYAKHQAIKIQETLEKAAIVDPTKREGINGLLSANYPGIIEATESANPEHFKAAFSRFYASCTTCHFSHAVPFAPLVPTTSISPVTSGSAGLWQEIQKSLRKEEEKKLQPEPTKK